MAHADIQAAVGQVQVIVARPVVVDLGAAATSLTEIVGSQVFNLADFLKDFQDEEKAKEALQPLFEPVIEPIIEAFRAGHLDLVGQIFQVIQQLSRVKVQTQMPALEEGSGGESPSEEAEQAEPPGQEDQPSVMTVDLSELAGHDPTERDREFGVCPIPMYEFEEEEVDLIRTSRERDEIRDVLKSHNILQYFVPPPDQLALGLADRMALPASELLVHLSTVPAIGHPYGDPELVSKDVSVADVVAALQEKGLLVEGEASLEVGPEGERLRREIRFKPREGLLSKLINRIKVTVDLSNRFIKP
jgi:hypothetical protein